MTAGSLTDRLRGALALFEGSGAPLTTDEVAARLDLDRRDARDRLERLVERDRLAAKTVGHGARVWWRPAQPSVTDGDAGSADRSATAESMADGVLERELSRQRRELQKRERALRETTRIVGNGDLSFAEQLDRVLGVIRETVGCDYATFSRVRDDEYVFEAVDAPADADLAAGDVVPLSATNCERVVASEQTLVLEDVATESPGIADRDGNAALDVACYIGAPVTVDGEVSGTFCVYDGEARSGGFAEWEVTFVELLANWVSQQREREQYVERLGVLNSLNGVVREIAEAVVDQSTREEVEAAVCERLAGADGYQLAWIGDVDVGSQTVTPRTKAGVDGYLDDLTISVDPDDAHSEGPTGRALRTGEIQTVQDHRADAGYGPWRDRVEKYGFRSSAAIPIVHEESVYGVLNVYAERPDAFEGREGNVISQIGEVVGHAIAATERKRALMSDEVVELEFHVQGVFETVGVDEEPDGTISLERAIPVKGDEYLVYGSATADAVDSVERLVDAIDHWTGVTFHDEGDTTFELRLSDAPVLSALASLGGSIDDAVIEDGDYRMTLHVSPGSDVRRIIDAVRAAYPTAELLKRRQMTRRGDAFRHTDRLLSEELTERQRAAVQAAYHAGFFEWPRDATGDDVAASLGISPPTFHQHLRKAEKKVFDALLSTSPAP